MNKSVIVVCDHGNASRIVGHFLRMELDRREISADILARGIFAKIPTDAEIMASEAVIVAFDEGQVGNWESRFFATRITGLTQESSQKHLRIWCLESKIGLNFCPYRQITNYFFFLG